ncbi:MAG: precorrin-3B synthase, partial [Streptosporangiaceae bacterium]|nr:precorrin-3B synthase [Streptosporangiaceae bacterium]
WGAVAPVDEVADRLAHLASQFLDARGTGTEAPWHIHELTRPLRPPVAADPRIPAPVPPLPYGPVPGGSHVPAEDGALTPELVKSILEQATDATYVVVTPWRGVLVPSTPEVSE